MTNQEMKNLKIGDKVKQNFYSWHNKPMTIIAIEQNEQFANDKENWWRVAFKELQGTWNHGFWSYKPEYLEKC